MCVQMIDYLICIYLCVYIYYMYVCICMYFIDGQINDMFSN